jgi:hypothetical protein
MEKSNKNETSDVTLKDIILHLILFLKFLKSKWLIILVSGVLGCAIGIFYAIIKKPSYIATCSFVLDENKTSGLSQYANLASMAGLDLGTDGGDIFVGDNIAGLYTSRLMIAKALLSKINVNGKPQLLIDRYVNFLNLRKDWKKKDGIDSINFNSPLENFNRKQDSLLIVIATDIDKKVLVVSRPDKKLSIINVNVKFGDEQFAKAFNDSLVATVNNFYIKTKTKKTALNVAVLQRQADSVKTVLNNSISGVASALDAAPNANPLLLTLKVPSQKKQVDVQASSAVYAEIVKNLELAKITLRQETPLIQVIDNPIFPLTIEKAGKIKCLVIGFVLGSMFAICCVSAKKAFTKLMA